METCIARFMCGHEEQVEVSGTEEEVRKRIEWYGANCQCSECRTKRFREEMSKTHDEVVMKYYIYKTCFEDHKILKDSYDSKEKTVVVFVEKGLDIDAYIRKKRGQKQVEVNQLNNKISDFTDLLNKQIEKKNCSMQAKETIYSLTDYVLHHKNENDDPYWLFNNWSKSSRITIDDYEEAVWAIQHIKMILQMDDESLKEAMSIDRMYIEKTNGNPPLQKKA